MSVYDELNGLKIDLAEYGEEELTEAEQKRWERRVRGRLSEAKKSKASGRARRSRWLIPAAAALLLAIGATLPAGQQTLARFPFVAGLLERFAGYGEDVDYSAYKTQIGETKENEYGRLTLNEIVVDTDRLLITSTLEPSDNLKIEDGNVVYLDAKVTINGRSGLETGEGSGSGSDGENGRYTTYQSIQLSEIPAGDKLDIKIEYNRLSWWNPENKPAVLSEPWIFEIETSRAALLAETHVVEMNRTVDLINGERIKIEKVVFGPVSTLVYYERTKPKDAGSKLDMYGFEMISDQGKKVQSMGGAWRIDRGGYARYAAVDLKQGNYSLIPYDGTKEKELGEAVPIKE